MIALCSLMKDNIGLQIFFLNLSINPQYINGPISAVFSLPFLRQGSYFCNFVAICNSCDAFAVCVTTQMMTGARI